MRSLSDIGLQDKPVLRLASVRERVASTRWWMVGVIAAALVLCAYILAQVLPVGGDYYWWYYRIPQEWLAGETKLYDEASRGYYLPPWALVLLLPFTALDTPWAMATFTLLSLAIVCSITYAYARESGSRRPWLAVLAVTLCPYFLVLVFTGTPDAWSLLGIYLAYRAKRSSNPWLLGAALLLAGVRPQNLVLTGPALVLAVRKWPSQEWAKLAALPALTFLSSFLLFGWDWPVRWWDNFQALPPSPGGIISTYKVTEIVGVPLWLMALLALGLGAAMLLLVWRHGLPKTSFEMILAASAVISPYMRTPGFVVLLALSWTGLAVRRPKLAAASYAISLPTLVVPLFWERLGVLDQTFPLVLLGLLALDRRLSLHAGTSAGT